MKEALLCISIIWVIGWIRELAIMAAIREKTGFTFPSNKVKQIFPVVIFFTWPYWYFYGKQMSKINTKKGE